MPSHPKLTLSVGSASPWSHVSLNESRNDRAATSIAPSPSAGSGPSVAGIYGMNFEHMPELSWTLGYPLTLVLIVVIMLALYWRFRRSGWL